MCVNFLGCFENIHFHVKTLMAIFWATFEKFWATLSFRAWSHWLRMAKISEISATILHAPTLIYNFSFFDSYIFFLITSNEEHAMQIRGLLRRCVTQVVLISSSFLLVQQLAEKLFYQPMLRLEPKIFVLDCEIPTTRNPFEAS